MRTNLKLSLLLLFMLAWCSYASAQNEYIERFNELRGEFYDPANGYFSPDGAPYHSIETLIVEAPDHGHESTSELYSYWIWLEAMHGRVSGDWQPLNQAWGKMEDHIIPSQEDQPTNSAYNASSPATYAPEFPEPSFYPSPLQFNTPVGNDPVSPDLTSAYGPEVYGMHWLLDCDNFYGYGTRGDGVTTPSFINTFQRGEQESVWETVPQPSWEDFSWGGDKGYLPLFTLDQNYAQQWRYTNAPDADARVVQAMYWAAEWAKEQDLNPNSVIPLSDASKMGDFTRLAMFDKYFKPLGAQSPDAAGSGYESAHYLMSWYYAWGGSISTSGTWAWRIGSSHCHFGYQNPVAAWALNSYNDLMPASQNGARDFGTSLDRQLEFYRYLQSADGAIAGGATNSWNGDYSPYPAGKSTFYGMAYDEHPVYHDPGSNSWGGWQAWSMERVAEYYYLSNDPRAKELMDNWVPWVKEHVQLTGSTFQIPAELEWSGEPDTWNPDNPGDNSNLRVTVTGYNQDLGIAASFAKALIYYAAATEKYETIDEESRVLAKEILDRMWNNFRDEKGLSSPEERGDYVRFFEQEVYVPESFNGTMPNGDVIENGINFLDIRSNYRNDPDFQKLQSSYESGQPYVARYHRSWALIEIALANAEYGFFFGEGGGDSSPTVSITSPANNAVFMPGADITIEANASDDNAVASVEFFRNGISLGVDNSAPYAVIWTDVAEGSYALTAVATDDAGNTKTSATVNITVGEENNDPVAVLSASPLTGQAPLAVAFDASGSSDADGDALSYSWSFGDGASDTGAVVSHTYTAAGTYTATVTVTDGKGGSDEASVTIEVSPSDPSGCDFGTPLASGLPSINQSFNNIHVLGAGGPDLSNVTNFGINWSIQHNGLWQMSFNTNNGQPNWWIDLRTVSASTFNQAQPDITFSNSGIPGLDGSYWVALDNGNFVMVSKSGGFSIYFSNSSTPPVCDASNSRLAQQSPETESRSNSDIVVYPNPAANKLNVVVKDGYTWLRLVDVRGRVVLDKQATTSNSQGIELDVSGFKPGMYLLHINNGDRSEIKKVGIKMK